MDTRTIILGAKGAGATALVALLLYSGMALAQPGVDPADALLGVAFALLLALAGLWSLERLGQGRGADGLALLVLGLAPATTFVGWWLWGDARTAVFESVLWLNLVAGLATAVLAGWLLAREPSPARARARTARTG